MESFRFNTLKRHSRLLILVSSLTLLFLGPFTALSAEQIRGKIIHSLKFKQDFIPVEADIGLRELTQIKFESDEYLKGLILQVVSPQAALQFRESFMLTIFSSISPPPNTSRSYYNAKKIFSAPFPTQRKTYVDLPIAGAGSWNKSTPSSAMISGTLASEDFPLIFVIDPVMKGIPSDVSSSKFRVTLTPILKDIGALDIDILNETLEGEVYFLVDGMDIGSPDKLHHLHTGVHNLEVKSDRYLDYQQSFGIEQAKTTSLELKLEPALTYIRFDAPEGAVIFFDGEELERVPDKKIETEPGEHVVLMRVGDYSVSKKIDIQGGKTYKVSLFFDILVDDN